MIKPLQLNQQQPTRTIVGCYTRFSDEDLQTQASLDSQVHECTDAASGNGWTLDSALIFSDAGISGETLETRTGLTSLLKLVESGKAPFAGIIIDDTNRLGRRVSDVLRICEIFKFHDVFLYFVNPKLDSRDPQFERLIIDYANEDQNFLHKLRHAVRRGQKDRARKGLNPGGFRYGYKTELVPDPTRRGSIARPAIKGTRIIILEEEAVAVRQIFAWARDGISFQKIADRCTTANYPAPGRRVGVEAWNFSNVGCILHNPIYKGRLEWGRTRQAKHPVTGKSIAKPVPEEEWIVEYRPELVIVSSELWDQAQATIATHQGFGLSKLGGMAKRSGEDVTLLVGLLACGICGGSIVACGYGPKSGRVLNCKKHRSKKQCTNAHSVNELTLEDGVIQKIIQEVLSPTSVDEALSEFHGLLAKEIENQIQEARKKRGRSQSKCAQVRLVETSIQNIIASLRDYGPSTPLLDELAKLEGRKTLLQNQKSEPISELVIPSFEEVRKFFMTELQNLPNILRSNRLATREAFRRHLDRLILIPEFENGVPVYRIKGAFRPFDPSSSVMPSAPESGNLRHYKEFTIMFELIVPALTNKKNYLSHPSCPSEEVRFLASKGLTIGQIASKLSTTIYIVMRVLRAMDLQSGEVNYLSHPKCSTQALIEGRKLGKTHSAIATELGISLCVVMAVQRALVASGVKVPQIGNPHSTNRNIDYLNYPKCPAVAVVKSRSSGQTMAEIASAFGVSAKIISHIIHAVQTSTGSRIEPVPGRVRAHRFPHTDYLNHPKCPTVDVARLQSLGRTIAEIAIELRISYDLCMYVSQAMKDPSKRFRAQRSVNSKTEISAKAQEVTCPPNSHS